MVRSPPTLKMNPSGWQTYQSIFFPPSLSLSAPPLLSANLLCSDCSLSPCLLPLSSFSRTQTLFQSAVRVKGTKSVCLTRSHRQSLRFSSSMLPLSFPLSDFLSSYVCILFLFFESLSAFLCSFWLVSHGELPHELSRIWSCCCHSLCSLLRKSPEEACVCVCVHAGASLFWYSKSVRAKCAIAVRANRHTLLKVSQEYTQKASMPAHTQTHTQAMGFLGLQCKSAQRAPTSSWKAASYKGEAYTQSFSWRQQTRLSRVSEGKCHTRG